MCAAKSQTAPAADSTDQALVTSPRTARFDLQGPGGASWEQARRNGTLVLFARHDSDLSLTGGVYWNLSPPPEEGRSALVGASHA